MQTEHAVAVCRAQATITLMQERQIASARLHVASPRPARMQSRWPKLQRRERLELVPHSRTGSAIGFACGATAGLHD